MGADENHPTARRPTLLERAPPTDPAVLIKMEFDRISHRHYSAIGQVAGAWAYFERVVDFWIMEFGNIPLEIGTCLTAQWIGLRPRMDAFIALVRHLGASKKWNDDLEKLYKDARGLAESRHRAVHDVWDLTWPKTPIRQEATAAKKLRLTDQHVPTAELTELRDNIHKLISRFGDVALKISSELRPSPGKEPPTPAP